MGTRLAVLTLVLGLVGTLAGGPVQAAQVYPVDRWRLDLWRAATPTATTIARYEALRPRSVGTTSAYSNRIGSPVGLLMVGGRVLQGSVRRRCILAFDRRGEAASIGYRLPGWAWSAFEAGPCVIRSGEDYILAEEDFSHAFLRATTERALLCVSTSGKYIALLRFRGSLWQVPAKMAGLGLDRCINLDGGSQLIPNAVNPAVLGLVPKPNIQ